MHAICGSARLGKNSDAQNQDNCAATRQENGLRTMAVADGLGSHPYSEEASRVAVEAAMRPPVHVGGEDAILRLMRDAQASVIDEAKRFYASRGESVPDSQVYSTTLIVGMEQPGSVRFAWLGNGAILHIRGAAILGATPKRVPWQACNLLLPHMTANEQGKDALTRFLTGAADASMFRPSVIEVGIDSDDNNNDAVDGEGDIFVLCTDGILSAEDRKIGKVADGGLWEQIDEAELRLYALLREIAVLPEELTDQRLDSHLEAYLQELRACDLQQDDMALAVYLSGRFLRARDEWRSSRTAPVGNPAARTDF
jgi:PPM family protein phosphatase